MRSPITETRATTKLAAGPARPTMMPPNRRLRRAVGVTGTGRPPPKPARIRAMEPSGSRCLIGLRVRRPWERAVWSPWRLATAAWLNSWKVMPTITAITKATNSCGSSRIRNSGEPMRQPRSNGGLGAGTRRSAATLARVPTGAGAGRIRRLGRAASGADDLVDKGRGLDRLVAPAEGGQQAVGGGAGGVLVAGQDAPDRLPGPDLVAELGRELDGHGRVDVVVLALTAGAQGGRHPADGLGVDRRQPAVLGRLDLEGVRRLGQDGQVVGDPGVAALGGHELAEPLQPVARLQGPPGVAAARLGVGGRSGERRHVAGKGQAEVEEPSGAVAPEGLDRLADLDGVADQPPQRLVHLGYEGRGA